MTKRKGNDDGDSKLYSDRSVKGRSKLRVAHPVKL